LFLGFHAASEAVKAFCASAVSATVPMDEIV
jgi:hypothetical protein